MMHRLVVTVALWSVLLGCADSSQEARPSVDEDIEVATPSADQASVITDAEQAGRLLHTRLDGDPQSLPKVGFNNNGLALPLGDRQFLDSLRTFNPQIIRYPGGTVGDFWDWKNGWVDTTALPPKYQSWPRTYPYAPHSLEALAAFANSLDADVLFSLNAYHGTLSSQVELLRSAQDAGLPIRYVELGNEYYFDQPRYAKRYSSGEAYGQEMKTWDASVSSTFDSVKVATIATLTKRGYSDRRSGWNEGVQRAMGAREVVSVHPYMYVNQPHVTPAVDTVAFFSIPFQRINRLRNETYSAPELWVTEYNLIGPHTPPVRTTWAHGLSVGAYTMLLAQTQGVSMILAHQMTGANPTYRAIETPRWGGQYRVTAYGNALRVVFNAFRRFDKCQRIVFATHPRAMEDSASAMSPPTLLGMRLVRPDAEGGFLINLSAEAQKVSLDSFNSASIFHYTSYSSRHVLAKQQHTGTILTERGVAKTNLTAPPYSIVFFEEL